MIDLTHLDPAPWQAIPGDGGGAVTDAEGFAILLPAAGGTNVRQAEAALAFAALARNAYDVIIRRNWLPQKRVSGQWMVEDERGNLLYREDGSRIIADCPFAALVEADRYFAENVEKKSSLQEKESGT